MGQPLARQRPPTLADLSAGKFEAPQKRRSVDEIEQRIAGDFRRDVRIVIGEHFGKAPLLDEIERQMPAVMDGQRMRLAPGRARGLEKTDAFELPALGFQHMGDRVHRPTVFGVARDRAAPGLLGAAKLARLLQPERILAEHIAVVRVLATPCRQYARHRIADGEGMTEIEIAVMGKAQGKGVGRMVDEYVLPDVGRPDDLAGGPGLGGLQMTLFARRGASDRRLGGADRPRHRRIVAAKAVQQEQ